MAEKQITLITGGARSGKSSYALSLAKNYKNKAFIATAEHSDIEMSERIQKHRNERGDDFLTLEEPIDLNKAILGIPPETDILLIDCLTVWLGNLYYHKKISEGKSQQITTFLEGLSKIPFDLIVITNEIGMGIVPENEWSRHFRDDAGRLNQDVARKAQKVIMMVSGIPMTIKG